jgi:protein arginine N-methyltransferase 1
LERAVVPGTTRLLDVGSGTGYLSFIGARLGAKQCTLVEQSEDLVTLSKKLAQANTIERCRFICGHSTQMELKEKFDLVVSETLGNFAYEENIIEIMNDARRFLAPGGAVLPKRIRQFVCPVITARLWDELNVEKIDPQFNFGLANATSFNNMYVKDIVATDLLEQGRAAKEWDAVDFDRKNGSQRKGSAEWSANAVMTMYGLAVWWECDVWDNIQLSTSPLSAATHWKQIFLPFEQPIPLIAGEHVVAHIHSDTRWEVKINVRWTMEVKGLDGNMKRKKTMDMRRGYVR